MSIVEKINNDKINAMREKNASIKSVTQIVLARFKNEEIELKRALTEEEVLAIVRKELKQTEESLKDAEKAMKDTDEYKTQVAYLTALLPAAMSAEEVTKKVNEIAKNAASQTKGDVMKAVMAELKGKADGKLLSAAVDAYLKSGN